MVNTSALNQNAPSLPAFLRVAVPDSGCFGGISASAETFLDTSAAGMRFSRFSLISGFSRAENNVFAIRVNSV